MADNKVPSFAQNNASSAQDSSTPITEKKGTPMAIPSFAQRNNLVSSSSSSEDSGLLGITNNKETETQENKNSTLGIIGRTVAALPTSIIKGTTTALDKISDAPSYLEAQIFQRKLNKNPDSLLTQEQAKASMERYQEAADTHLLGDTVKDWEKKVDAKQEAIMTDNPTSKAAEIGYKATELAESAGRMVPGIVASAVTGGVLGAATGATELAASAGFTGAVPTAVKVVEGVSSAVGLGTMWGEVYSSSIDQSVAEGRDFVKAGDKAFGDATLEVATELMFGGIADLGNISWANALSKKIGDSAIIKGFRQTVGDTAAGTAIGKAVSKVPSFMSTKFGKTLFGDIATSGELGGMVGEAIEEMVSEFVSPYIERATTNPDAEDATLGQILEAGLGGALLSVVMSPLGTIQENIQYKKVSNAVQQWIKSDENAIAVLNTAMNSGLTGDIQTDAINSFSEYTQLNEMKEYTALDPDLIEQVAIPEYVQGVTTHQDVTDAFARYGVAIKEQMRRNMEKAAAGQYKSTLDTVIGKNDAVVKASEELNKANEAFQELKKVENPSPEQIAKIAELQQTVVQASANLTKARQEAKANIETDLAKAYADGTMLSTYGEEIYEQYKAYRFVEEQKSIPANDPTKGRVNLRIKDGTVTNDKSVPLQSFTRDELSKVLYNGVGYNELNEKQLTDLENEIRTYMANEKSRISNEQQAIKDEINAKLEENGSTMRVEFESLGEGIGAEWRDGKVIFNSDRVINRNMANYYLGHEVIHEVFNQFRLQNNIKGLEEFKKDLQAAMFYSGFSFDEWFNSQAMRDKYMPRFFNEEVAKAAKGLKLTEEQLDKILKALSSRNFKTLNEKENRALEVATANAKSRYEGGEYIKFDAETGEESKVTIDSSGEEEVYAKFSAYLFGANNLINRLSGNYKEMLGYMGAAAQRSAIKGSSNKGLSFAQAKVTETIANAINNADQTETPVNSSEVSRVVNEDILLNAPSIYDENFYSFDYTLLPSNSDGWNTQMWGDYWEKVLPAVTEAWDDSYQEVITLDPAVAKLASRTHPIFRDSDNRLKVLYHGTPESIMGWTEFELKDLDKGIFSSDSYNYIVDNNFAGPGASEFMPIAPGTPVFTEDQIKAGVKTEGDAFAFAQETGLAGGFFRLYLFSSNPIVINNRFVETPYAQISSVMDEFTNGKYKRPQLEEELKPISATTLTNEQLKSIADSIVKTPEGSAFAGTDSGTLYTELLSWVDLVRAEDEAVMEFLANSADGAGGILDSYIVALPDDVKFSTIQKSTAYKNNHGTTVLPVTIDGKNYILINTLGGYLDAEDFVGRTLSANKKDWGKLFNLNNISSVFHDPDTMDGDNTYFDYNGPEDRIPGYTNIDYLMAAARKVGKDAVFVWNVNENGIIHNEAIGDYNYIKSIYNSNPTVGNNIMADELLDTYYYPADDYTLDPINTVLASRITVDARDKTYSLLTRAIARRHPGSTFSTANTIEAIRYFTKPANGVTLDEIRMSGIIPWMDSLNEQGIKTVSTYEMLKYLEANEKNFEEIVHTGSDARFKQYTTGHNGNEENSQYTEWLYRQPGLSYQNQNRHWEEDSIALHIREQRFKSADGQDVTIIEENQSDPNNDISKRENSKNGKSKNKKIFDILNQSKNVEDVESEQLKEKLKNTQTERTKLENETEELSARWFDAYSDWQTLKTTEDDAAVKEAIANANAQNANVLQGQVIDIYNKSTAPKVILKVADNILNYWKSNNRHPQATINSALKYLKNSNWVREGIKNPRFDRTSWWLKGLSKSECNHVRYYLFNPNISTSLADPYSRASRELRARVISNMQYSEETLRAKALCSEIDKKVKANRENINSLGRQIRGLESAIADLSGNNDLYTSGDNLLQYGIRRSIQHAIDNNSDYIAVASPDNQSERYGEWSISNPVINNLIIEELEKTISEVNYYKGYKLNKTDPVLLVPMRTRLEDINSVNQIRSFLAYATNSETGVTDIVTIDRKAKIDEAINNAIANSPTASMQDALGIKPLKSYTHEYGEKIPSYLAKFGAQYGAKLTEIELVSQTESTEYYSFPELEPFDGGANTNNTVGTDVSTALYDVLDGTGKRELESLIDKLNRSIAKEFKDKIAVSKSDINNSEIISKFNADVNKILKEAYKSNPDAFSNELGGEVLLAPSGVSNYFADRRLEMPGGDTVYTNVANVHFYNYNNGEILLDLIIPILQVEEDLLNYKVQALEINDEMRRDVMNNGLRRFESTDTDAEMYRQWQAAQNQYGTYGEDGVPRRTVSGKKVSEFAQNVYTDETNSPKVNEQLRKTVLEGAMSFTPISDKEAQTAAHSWLNRYSKTDANGVITLELEQAIGDYLAAGLRGENANKYSIARGELLMKSLSAKGDAMTDAELNLWSKLAASLAVDSHRVAAATQAFSMMKKTTADGRLFYIQRCLENLKQEFKNRKDSIFEKSSAIASKLNEYTIPEDLLEALRNAKTVEELDNAEQAIINSIADAIPASIETRLMAWRYLSMLGNVRTHERNIISNAAMWIARGIKDKMAGATEDVFLKDSAGRTKTVKKVSAEIKAFAKGDFSVIKDALTFGGKMGFETEVSQARKKFGNSTVGKFLEAISSWNGDLLEREDAFFLRLTYTEALANYLAANNYTVEFITSKSEAANEALGNARDYAMLEAQKATYREANELASFLNRMEKKSAVNALLIGGLAPYKRTPMNILKRGLEYSPIGVVEGVKELIFDVSSGRVTAAEGIDRLCSGLTGTMILALGLFLGGAGIMKAGGSGNDREEYYDEMTGIQKYSITLGDKNYTLDWLTPISMPLFAGVQLMEAINTTDDGESDLTFNEMLDAISTMIDPLTNLSLLQGINDALNAYGDSNKLGQLALSAGESYVSQFIPTVFGQVARTIDPTRRSTYAPKDSTALGGSAGEKFLNRIKSKLPFVSTSNEPYVDMWGRTEERQGNVLQRAAEQMLVPWYEKQRNSTAVDDALSEIFAETGDTSILPATPNSYFTINGETKYLSSADYTEVKTIVGQLSYKGVEQALNSNYFTKLTSDEQSDVIGNIYSFARAYAKYNYANKYGLTITADSNIEKVNEAMKVGLTLGEYFTIKKLVSSVQSEKDSKGKTISGSKKQRQINLMTAYGLTKEQMNIFL